MTSAASPSRTIFVRDPATRICHSHRETVGLAFDTLAGVASTLASLSILILIFVSLMFWRGSPALTSFQRKGGWANWEGLHVSVVCIWYYVYLYPLTTRYQFALFVAELIQGVAHAMDVRWVVEGGAETGAFCTAQGSPWFFRRRRRIYSGLISIVQDFCANSVTLMLRWLHW